MLSSLWLLLLSSPLYGFTLSQKRYKPNRSCYSLWEGEESIGEPLMTNGLQLANRFLSLEELVSTLSDVSATETLDVHGFEWLYHLKKLGHNTSRKMARHLMLQWIVANKAYRHAPWRHWRGDTLGYRISNWIMSYDFFGLSADETFDKTFWCSVSEQIHHLTRLPLYTMAPQQRWMALKGLILSTHASKHLPKLEATLADIVWPDGGHKDLTWQIWVLRDLIDIQRCLKLTNSLVVEAIHKMAGVVRFLRNSNGLLCPLVRSSELGIVSSRFIDMVLSMSEVQERPPIRLPHTGVERLQHALGLFFIRTRPLATPFIPGGIGVLDWVWTPRSEPMLMGDIHMEARPGTTIRFFDNQVCEVRQAKWPHQKVVWQGRYHGDPYYLQRELVLAPNALQGGEKWVGPLPTHAATHGRMWVRFHLCPQATMLDTLGHFHFEDRVWKLENQTGVLEKIGNKGFRIGSDPTEGVRWTVQH